MEPVKNLTLLTPGYLRETNYLARAQSTVQEVAAQLGCGCTLLYEQDLIRKMQDPAWHGRLDTPTAGIIIFSPYSFDYDSYLRILRRQKHPCVLLRRKTQVPGVVMFLDNDASGTRLAMEHLYGLGHRTIGYFQRSSGPYGSERKHMYRRFLRERGLPARPDLVLDQYTTVSRDVWQRKIGETFPQLMTLPGAPTAFFCYSDDNAIDLVQLLQGLGQHIPRDVAVVGYDDSDAAQTSQPPLTSVHLPIEEMCAAACRLIIEEGTETSPSEVMFANTLTVRQSCGAKPAGQTS
jgi:LacI family transcriptional regulator